MLSVFKKLSLKTFLTDKAPAVLANRHSAWRMTLIYAQSPKFKMA